MFKSCLLIPAILFIGTGIAVAQDKSTVEVQLASENVPEGLKAGAKVDLKMITGKTVTATGKASIITNTLVADIEVAAVTKVEKPKSPEQAIKVELRVTKEQAAKIENVKKQTVTTMVTKPGGGRETVQMPVPLRIEMSKPEKK